MTIRSVIRAALNRLAARPSKVGFAARRLLGRPEASDVVDLYRGLLGREPESPRVVARNQGTHWRDVVVQLATSAERASADDAMAQTPGGRLLAENVRPGDRVVLLGDETGRHGLGVAALVGPEGAVEVFEPDPKMRQASRARVASHPQATVHDVSTWPGIADAAVGPEPLHVLRVGAGVRWPDAIGTVRALAHHQALRIVVERSDAQEATRALDDLRALHFPVEFVDSSGEARTATPEAIGGADGPIALLARRVRPDPKRKLTRADVVWAYRLLLDREPDSHLAVTEKATDRTVAELRQEILESEEFRRALVSADWADAPQVVIKELDGVRIFLDLSDSLARTIARGEHESGELDFVRRTLRPGDHAVDVGGHMGVFALTMARIVGPSGRVWVYEPVRENADLLEASISENGFDDVVTLERAIVGDHEDVAGFVLPNDRADHGAGSLATAATVPDDRSEIRRLPMVTLDGSKIGGPVRLIKLDAEGAERLCLRGARELLRRDHPVLLCELNEPQLRRISGCDPRTFISEVESIGYTCRRLVDGEIGDRVRDSIDELVSSVVFLP